MNLPSSSTSNSTVSAAGMVGTASGVADPGAWLDVHREVKQCLHEARQSLSKRDGAADSGNFSAAAEAAAAAKRVLVKASGLVNNLSDGLRRMQESGRLGDGEIRRRRDLVSAAKMERDGLDKLASSMPGAPAATSRGGMGQVQASSSNRSNLLGGHRPAPTGRVLGAPLPETDRTRELDNQGVLLLQKREMESQDQAIDQLAAIIRRQKEMGIQINEEVERQTELLDSLDEDVDRVEGKVRIANRRIKKM